MAKKTGTDADNFVMAVSEHVETTELLKRELVLSAEQVQKEKETAIANIYEMAGKIKTTNFNKSQSAFFSLLMLKKAKDAKEYRTSMGMSWEQFCEHVGVNRRWVDEQLSDLKPFKTEFLEDFLRFSDFPFNKIKYLGESVTEENSGIKDGAISYNGETIPIDAEHKDEIQALLETFEENHKKEKEESDAKIRAKDKVLAAKEKVMNDQEREISRLKRTVPKSELTEEEQDAVNLLARVQTDFLTSLSDVKKKIKFDKAPEIVLRQYYYLLIFFSKMAMEERLLLNQFYEGAEEVSFEISEDELPAEEVLIDNLPTTAGLDIGKKVKAKMEERKIGKRA